MSKNGSILFVINTMLEGGAAKMMGFVANTAIDAFQNVYVTTFFDQKTCSSLDADIDQKLLSLDCRDNLWRLRCFQKLRKLISEIKPDCICAFIADVSVMARIASLGKKIVFASAERGDPYAYSKKWIILEKWAYRKSDICFFQVERARDFFDDTIKNKSIVIPNPYTSTTIIQPNTGKRNKTIVGVGRLEYQKGFDILISAFAIVHEKHPDYTLVIYGDGSKRNELESLVTKLYLEDYISFPGYIKNVQEVLLHEGIYVLSSRFEGIPNSLIEAMAVGIPTISTDCSPGGPDFLTKGGTRGLLVPVEDEVKLADGIISLIENPELRMRISLAGIQVREELDESKIKKLWIDSFEKMKKLRG